MNKPAFIPVRSEFLSDNALEKIIKNNLARLHNICDKRINSDEILETEKVYYFIITGGTEQQVLEFQKQRNHSFENEEIILLAHASHNSLPACLEVLAKLQQDGKKGKIIYLPQGSETLNDNHKPDIKKLHDQQALKGFRIGLIGEPSDWLVASSPSAEIVQKIWGAEIIPIELTEVEKFIRLFSRNETDLIKHNFVSLSNSVMEPTEDEIEDNIRVYLALKKLVADYDLNALTIRCFDLVLDLKTTGCFALSRLNDEGIIAGCEGDLNSTIGMIWAQKKYSKLPWMANPSQLDLKENSLWLTHCTVPCSLVTDYKIRSHFESGLGVGIQGNFPKQEVKLIRIGGKNLNQIWQVDGKIIQTGNADNLCRTQIKVKLDDRYSVQDLLTNPLGNHLIIVPNL